MLFHVEIIARDFPEFSLRDTQAVVDASRFTPEMMDRLSTEGRYLIGKISPAPADASMSMNVTASTVTVRPSQSSYLISNAAQKALQTDLVLSVIVDASTKFDAAVAAIKATTSEVNHAKLIDLYRFRTVWARAFPLAYQSLSAVQKRLAEQGIDARITPAERLDRCRLTAYRNNVAEGALELSMEAGLVYDASKKANAVVTYPVFNVLFSDGSHIGSLYPSQATHAWEGESALTTGDLDVFNADNLHRIFAATLVPFNVMQSNADNKPG